MPRIRALEPADAPAFQAFVRALSAETRRERFLGAVHELGPGMLRQLTQAASPEHCALVAISEGAIIAESRYALDEDGASGEIALVVAESWRRLGLGGRLLDAIVACAARAGLARLRGEVFRTNVAMQALVRKAGFELRSHPRDARLAEIDLRLAPRSLLKSAIELTGNPLQEPASLNQS
ncbi:MAG: GNAT family N-acetyltransferase [Betaproteobacteria bacterium]|nr:GNAT family N-acetyltransferase [Betaproteobacteria bacterium]